VKISIVLPAFNEEKLIAATLRSVRAAAAGFAEVNWESEVIVCDNNSSDRTAELARQAGATVVFEPRNQIGRARNRGAEAATGDWLIFVDADSHPSRELFLDVAAAIRTGRYIGGGSTVRLDEADRLILRALVTAWNAVSRFQKWMAGSFIFCERAVFHEVGRFSEELFVSEEIDFSKRLRRAGKNRGKKLIILDEHPLVTSARKAHLYSPREHLTFMLRTALSGGAAMRDKSACTPWYDGRR